MQAAVLGGELVPELSDEKAGSGRSGERGGKGPPSETVGEVGVSDQRGQRPREAWRLTNVGVSLAWNLALACETCSVSGG